MRSSVQEYINKAKASLLANQRKSVLEVSAVVDATKNTIFSQLKPIDLTKGEIEQVKIAITSLDVIAEQIQGVRAVLHGFKHLDVSPLRSAGNASLGVSFMLEEFLREYGKVHSKEHLLRNWN